MAVPFWIWVMQPILPVAITSGSGSLDIGDLAGSQLHGDLRLEQIVGSRRAAADMALGNILDGEPRAA